jgi:diacylglycerol kinase
MKKFLRSVSFALKGIRSAIQEEPNIRIELAIAFVVICAGIYFQITNAEWLAISLVIGLVLTAEMINTAIEDLVDLVTTEWKPQAGRIKDIAAGATLIASMISITVGILVFWKYLTA